MDEILKYTSKLESERNEIFDTGAFNEICLAYTAVTLHDLGYKNEKVAEALEAMNAVFDEMSAAEAREALRKGFS